MSHKKIEILFKRCIRHTEKVIGPQAAAPLKSAPSHGAKTLEEAIGRCVRSEKRCHGIKLRKNGKLSLEEIVLLFPEAFDARTTAQARRTLQEAHGVG